MYSSTRARVAGGMGPRGSLFGAACEEEGLEVSVVCKMVFIEVLHLMSFTDTNGHRLALVFLWCASVDVGARGNAGGVDEGGGSFLLSQLVLGAGEGGTTGGIVLGVLGAGRWR